MTRRILRYIIPAAIIILLSLASFTWLSWPTGTARQFHQLMIDGDVTKLNAMLVGDVRAAYGKDNGDKGLFFRQQKRGIGLHTFRGTEIEFKQRSIVDMVLGRREFEVTVQGVGMGISFVVVRGRVRAEF